MTPEALDELLEDVRRDRAMVETDLAQRAAALVNNMRRLLDRVAAGDRVNRLGEVQRLGPEVDGLCRDLGAAQGLGGAAGAPPGTRREG